MLPEQGKKGNIRPTIFCPCEHVMLGPIQAILVLVNSLDLPCNILLLEMYLGINIVGYIILSCSQWLCCKQPGQVDKYWVK